MQAWQDLAREHDATLFLLAEVDGFQPWLAEMGVSPRGDKRVANIVVGYGSPAGDGAWVKVGTFDPGWAGTEPTADQDAAEARTSVGMRLVSSAVASSQADPKVAIDAAVAFIGSAQWKSTVLRIDGTDRAGWSLAIDGHQVSFTTAYGRTVFIERSNWPAPVELVSSTDYALPLDQPYSWTDH
jgi:hypothetical protein